MDNEIVHSYECLGIWTKILKKRNSGNHIDIYIKTPEKKTLRSGAELLKFIQNNEKYWPVFDADLIHFKRNENQGDSKLTKDLKLFLNDQKKSLSSLDESQSLENEVKAKKNQPETDQTIATSSKLHDSLKSKKPKIGPKRMMQKSYEDANIEEKQTQNILESKQNQEKVDQKVLEDLKAFRKPKIGPKSAKKISKEDPKIDTNQSQDILSDQGAQEISENFEELEMAQAENWAKQWKKKGKLKPEKKLNREENKGNLETQLDDDNKVMESDEQNMKLEEEAMKNLKVEGE